MTSPKTVLEAIEAAILEDDVFLTDVSDVVLEELDLEKENTALSQPFVAIYPIDTIRSSPHDTERIGYVVENGKRIGERFKATFEMPIQIDIHTARGNSGYDMNDLGWQLNQLLRPYDHRNEDLPFTLDSETISDLHHFAAGDGERNDDLSRAPGLARWTHEAMTEFSHVVEATDHVDHIEVVHVPNSEDMTGDGTMIKYEY